MDEWMKIHQQAAESRHTLGHYGFNSKIMFESHQWCRLPENRRPVFLAVITFLPHCSLSLFLLPLTHQMPNITHSFFHEFMSGWNCKEHWRSSLLCLNVTSRLDECYILQWQEKVSEPSGITWILCVSLTFTFKFIHNNEQTQWMWSKNTEIIVCVLVYTEHIICTDNQESTDWCGLKQLWFFLIVRFKSNPGNSMTQYWSNTYWTYTKSFPFCFFLACLQVW